MHLYSLSTTNWAHAKYWLKCRAEFMTLMLKKNNLDFCSALSVAAKVHPSAFNPQAQRLYCTTGLWAAMLTARGRLHTSPTLCRRRPRPMLLDILVRCWPLTSRRVRRYGLFLWTSCMCPTSNETKWAPLFFWFQCLLVNVPPHRLSELNVSNTRCSASLLSPPRCVYFNLCKMCLFVCSLTHSAHCQARKSQMCCW